MSGSYTHKRECGIAGTINSLEGNCANSRVVATLSALSKSQQLRRGGVEGSLVGEVFRERDLRLLNARVPSSRAARGIGLPHAVAPKRLRRHPDSYDAFLKCRRSS